jgi:NADH-quinone oxidoreductase subunit L
MTAPLAVLAVLTVVAGWALGVPSEHGTRFARFVAPVFPLGEGEVKGVVTLMLALLSLVIVAGGLTLAWWLYVSAPVRAETIGRPRPGLRAFLLQAWYVDALYDRAIVRPLYALSLFLAWRVDLGVIDAVVDGMGRAMVAWARGFRRLQTGYVVNYALTMLVGAVALVGFLLARRP